MSDNYQRMTPGEARSSVRKITEEIHLLEPDSLITLYEIDLSDIKFNVNLSLNILFNQDHLRFHNMELLKGKIIKFNGETFYAMPIIAEGFEMSSSGELPRPKLTLPSMRSINAAELDDPSNNVWQDLKRGILLLNNLTGAKVTRIRTFAKYLDADNDLKGAGTDPDTNAQFPRETYYIDSKTLEDKNNIQFELTTFTDMENFKLPGRFVLSSRCPWAYRGEGCCYEFKGLTNAELNEQKEIHGATDHLPNFAPPIATYDNKKISEEVGYSTGSGSSKVWVAQYNPELIEWKTNCTNADLACPSEYDKTFQSYARGKVVYIKKDGMKYYFVCKGGEPGNNNIPVGHYTPPPNANYWVPDQCTKTLAGCKHRWGATGAAKNGTTPGSATYANKFLNFGGFPGTNTRISI